MRVGARDWIPQGISIHGFMLVDRFRRDKGETHRNPCRVFESSQY